MRGVMVAKMMDVPHSKPKKNEKIKKIKKNNRYPPPPNRVVSFYINTHTPPSPIL